MKIIIFLGGVKIIKTTPTSRNGPRGKQQMKKNLKKKPIQENLCKFDKKESVAFEPRTLPTLSPLSSARVLHSTATAKTALSPTSY